MFNFKSLTLAAAVLGLSAVAGIAADLPSRYAPRAPVFVAVDSGHSWTGFYVGLDGGRTFQNTKGYTVGVHGGFNQQIGALVIGLEGSGAFGNLDGVSVSGNTATSTKVSQLYTVTPRIGLAFDRVLVYGKGGLAVGNVKTTSVTTTSLGSIGTSDSGYHLGWTVGAGAEYALNKNWSLGAEYNFIRLNDFNRTTSYFGTAINTNRNPNIHQARLNVNYKF